MCRPEFRSFRGRCLPGLIQQIAWIVLLVTALSTQALAFTSALTSDITGVYYSKSDLFDGTASFQLNPDPGKELLFHLPPAWHDGYDNRVLYNLRVDDKRYQSVSREKLNAIEPPTYENIHFPQGIQIRQVNVNGVPALFKIINNPKLSPLKNYRSALLTVSLQKPADRRSVKVDIQFKTRFNRMSQGFQRLLWDFMPRPLGGSSENPDYKGGISPLIHYHIDIKLVDKNGVATGVVSDEYKATIPYLLMDQWDYQSSQFKLSYDPYCSLSQKDLVLRINRIMKFLKLNHLLAPEQTDLRFITWGGPLTTAGRTVFLPRRLFRYPNIFYKQFEITILSGIIQAQLKSRYLIDSNRHPWIMPAVQSEILRLFFRDRFKYNTRLFPWTSWLNPEYFADTSVMPWVENIHDKEVAAADVPYDISFYSHIYHPGLEKGVHLLWMLHDGRLDYRKHVVKRISDLINAAGKERLHLSREKFLVFFAETRRQKKIAETWLSAKGRVDYAIRNVDISMVRDEYRVLLDIENNGTLSPVFEIVFLFDTSGSVTKQAVNGAGQYELFFKNSPDQIVLDPTSEILDDDPVNNRWHFPVKTRLIWDFPSPENWLITISPLVGEGNTFDKNILGLNITTGYLTRTLLELNFWKNSDSQMLWTGEFTHLSNWLKGGQFYLKGGYLGAVSSQTIGVRHESFSNYPDLQIDFSLWTEKLDDLDDPGFSGNQRGWAGSSLSAEFSPFEYALSIWQMKLLLHAGRSLFQPETEYQQLLVGQFFRYDLGGADIHLGIDQGFSTGTVPLQRRYPMGGTEGMSGFPRSTDLLFYENKILEIGTTLPGVLINTDLNLLRLMWLHRIVPTLDFHFGQGVTEESETEEFTDVEFSLAFIGEFINRFKGESRFAIAKPLGHETYKDYRLILFTNWVF